PPVGRPSGNALDERAEFSFFVRMKHVAPVCRDTPGARELGVIAADGAPSSPRLAPPPSRDSVSLVQQPVLRDAQTAAGHRPVDVGPAVPPLAGPAGVLVASQVPPLPRHPLRVHRSSDSSGP